MLKYYQLTGNTHVGGTEWGDTGKGKVVDFLVMINDNIYIVYRYNGGTNAGHTIKSNDKKLVVHNIPSGAMRGTVLGLGGGMLVDPKAFFSELEDVKKLHGNKYPYDKPEMIRIDSRAALIMPDHKIIEKIREERAGKDKIGTTQKGIGPTYEDSRRRNTRLMVADLVAPDFKQRLRKHYEMKLDDLIMYGIVNPMVNVSNYSDALGHESDITHLNQISNKLPRQLFKKEIDAALEKWVNQVYSELGGFSEQMRPYVIGHGGLRRAVMDAVYQGRNFISECAQGTLLDCDLGTIPYVTSSNTTVGAMQATTGIPQRIIRNKIAVFKVYTTRVGGGPFPTEIGDEEHATSQRKEDVMTEDDWAAFNAGNPNAIAKWRRIKTMEFGATSGRGRRIGERDLVAALNDIEVNDYTEAAIMRFDVYTDIELKMCAAYKYCGEKITHMPLDLENAEPIYHPRTFYFPKSDFTPNKIQGMIDEGYKAVPNSIWEYLIPWCELVNTPVTLLGVGEESRAVVWKGIFEATSEFITKERREEITAWKKMAEENCKRLQRQ